MSQADEAAASMFNLFPQGFWGSVGTSVKRFLSNPQSGMMMAGSAGVNPLVASSVPEFPRLGPLVKTDYGLPPSERPDWRNPSEQWDARPIMQAEKPKQFAGRSPRAATQDDIDYFYGRGKYAPVEQPVAVSPASPYANKVPIQTPYGTIYASTNIPSGGGPSQAQSSRVTEIASLPPQSARLERIGEEARRAARIAQIRQKGAKTFNQQRLEQEEFFNIARNKRREEREEEARQVAKREVDRPSRSEERRRARAEGTQTTQRSWSNYSGPNPIRRRRGTDFYEDSPIYS